ncbi:MAG: hypothetical protein M1570_15525 [Chloroflexi bacterium]|nr:hypothetical protein [Chloroflexota bacterium]
MALRQWWARLALVGILFVATLACRTEDLLVAQQPSATPTHTPRPTFTPLPSPTVVATIPVIPTEIAVPTAVPVVATKAPTRAPIKKPTARPPTARPPTQPPVVVAPTQPPAPPTPVPVHYTYQATAVTCTHAGNAFIKGAVYNDKNDINSKTPGIKVAMGAADGSTQWVPPVTTDQYGEYTFVLTPNGPRPGSYWVWVLDGQGNRISQIGGPINMNNLSENDPNSCWFGSVDFYK